MVATALPATRVPVWFRAAALLGLAWNVFGVVQYLRTAGQDVAGFEAAGMTAAQAQVMAAAPAWLTAAFAIGVFSGIAGCVALLMRRTWAQPIFVISLAGYVVLWIGDAVTGIFAALGMPQVVVLTMVVVIAAILLGVARVAAARGLLR